MSILLSLINQPPHLIFLLLRLVFLPLLLLNSPLIKDYHLLTLTHSVCLSQGQGHYLMFVLLLATDYLISLHHLPSYYYLPKECLQLNLKHSFIPLRDLFE